MSTTNRLVFHTPGMSKAILLDLLGGLRLQDPRVQVADEAPHASLDSDPATVALIGAAGLAVVEIIKSVAALYLQRRKADPTKTTTPTVQVTVHLALGGRKAAIVGDVTELEAALASVPNDYAEIARVQIS